MANYAALNHFTQEMLVKHIVEKKAIGDEIKENVASILQLAVTHHLLLDSRVCLVALDQCAFGLREGRVGRVAWGGWVAVVVHGEEGRGRRHPTPDRPHPTSAVDCLAG